MRIYADINARVSDAFRVGGGRTVERAVCHSAMSDLACLLRILVAEDSAMFGKRRRCLEGDIG